MVCQKPHWVADGAQALKTVGQIMRSTMECVDGRHWNARRNVRKGWSTLREGVKGTGCSSRCRSSRRWCCSCDRSSVLRETFSGIGMASDAHAAAHSLSTSCARADAAQQKTFVVFGRVQQHVGCPRAGKLHGRLCAMWRPLLTLTALILQVQGISQNVPKVSRARPSWGERSCSLPDSCRDRLWLQA